MSYEPLLHIVLHHPEIPHNTGAIGRTCLAVGCKLWLVRPLGFQIDDYYLRRAGLDYWQYLEWEAVDDWQALVERLGGREPYFFSRFAQRSYLDAAYQPGDILVFGSESSGLPAAITERHAGRLVRIPTRPEVRSLNLSNTVAVAVFEAQRQWSPREPSAPPSML